MFECHFLLLYVNSFQLITKEKTFLAVFEKVNLAGVQSNDNLCIVKSVEKLKN